MAGKEFYGNQKVFVETEYDNVVVVDPNKVVNPDGTVEERLVNHENLITYANLQARVIPRTKLAIGSNYDDPVRNVGVAQMKVDFLQGRKQEDQRTPTESFQFKNDQTFNDKYFDTSWTDIVLPGQTLDDRNPKDDGDGNIFSIGKGVDTQMLGITRINVKMNPAFVPTVTIEMTDIQGRVLFERGDQSPYSVFMQLPYPIFTLTLKGYYGKAIKLELILKDFNARFDPSDGSYKITTNFIARSHAFLQDTLLDYLYATPHMYPKDYVIDNNSNGTADGTVGTETKTTTKGMEKIKEVYSLYKSKGLIDDNFPEITLNQMKMRLEYFNRYIMESYSKEDMSVLTDIVNFQRDIKTYRSTIYPNITDNWFSKYIDPADKYILNDGKSSVLYGFKKELDGNARKDALAELKGLIESGNKKLKQSPTFYDPGNYTIEGKKYESQITVNIKPNNLIKQIFDPNDFDYKKTYTVTKGSEPTDEELQIFENKIRAEFQLTNKEYRITPSGDIEETEVGITLVKFGDVLKGGNFQVNSFLAKLKKIEDSFGEKKKTIEKRLSEALAKKIVSSDVGLGFNPTINNVLAVICANGEAFYRLMDEVHDNAWDVRTDPDRLRAILPDDKSFGVDYKNMMSQATVGDAGTTLKDTKIVYPWPQYFQQEPDENGDMKYVIKYPGQPSIINSINGWDNRKWPEIQFVEEYLTASLERDKPSVNINYNNPTRISKYMGINAVEFPFDNLPYVNEEYVSFLYEIYERTYLGAHYSKIIRNNNFRKTLYNVFADFETINIKEGLLDSPGLTKVLKKYKFTPDGFLSYLRSISNNGQGSFYSRKERDIYTQTYIKGYVDKDYGIYSLDSILTDSTEIESTTSSTGQLEEYITGTSSNGNTFLDVFPFNNRQWLRQNLAKGNSVGSFNDANSTTDVMSFNILKKTLATFDEDSESDTRYTNKYFTYFNFERNLPNLPAQNIAGGSSTSFETNEQVTQYYDDREYKNYYLTEALLDYDSYYDTATNNLTKKQTTSLLNTPYFVNAIIKGTDNEASSVDNPYVGLGYLYLNSLPLPTLSEKYLSKSEGEDGTTETKWGDYIFAGLSKFAAIHKLPYLWVLKYGSIWHRYKQEKDGNGDILDDIWTDFDYVNAYDPIGNNYSKVYDIQPYNSTDITLTGATKYQTEKLTPILTVSEILEMKNGFYPKVINNTYRFFTGKDVFINYDNTELADMFNNGGFKMGKSQSNILPQGYDPNNTGRTLSYESWFQYFDIDGNASFDEDASGNLLLIPSAGHLKFTQAQREVLNSDKKLTQSLQSNQSIQNGQVRSLWSASNYGYFNNNWVKKPSTTEYIKLIDNSEDEQTSLTLTNPDNEYKSVEEIFAIFSKGMLDEFERHFLNFCKKEKDYEDIVFNPSNVNADYYNGVDEIAYDFNIEKVMKSLLFVKKPNGLGLNAKQDSKTIAELQMEKFVNLNSKQLFERDIIFKIGNPGGFNRRVFDSFSSNETLRPIDPINFDTYIENTVPTAGGGVSLSISQSINPDAWDALYKYVGEYVEDGMKYTDNGSYITDFFPDLNIRFTEQNVIDLSSLIKIYATKKYNDNNLTRGQFLSDFEDFMSDSINYQFSMLSQIFTKLNKELPNVKETQPQERISKLDGDTPKNELWTTFKNFNDRWISGQDVKGKTLFEEFLFLDKANRPIGDKVIINIEDMRYFLKNANSSESVLNLIGHILEKNYFTFMPVPSYSNFYGRNERVKEGMPDPSYSDVANNTFGTFLEVDTHGSEPKFLAIYVGKVSEHINTSSSNQNFLYGDDAFDITQPTLNPVKSSEDGVTNFSNRNKVVAFNVDFGTRNQSIFKSLSIDMAQRKNIAPTFQILANMGSMADGQKVAQNTANLYNFYKNASYTCSVVSMGNVMIQPTMYFNLRYVPMFYGPYLITGVNHDITPRDFVTTFEGVRATKYSLQLPDTLITSVNRDIVQNYLSDVRRVPSLASSTGDTAVRSSAIKNSNTNTSSKRSEPDESKCVAVQNINKPYVKYTTTTINQSEFRDVINNSSISSEDVKKYVFGVGFVETGTGQSLKAINHNYFNLKNMKEKPKWTVSFENQTCVKDGEYVVPYISFNNTGESVKFMSEVCKQYEPLIDTLLTNSQVNNDLAKAYTYLWYYTLRLTDRNRQLNVAENAASVIISPVDTEIKKNTVAKSLFDSAYNTFKIKNSAWDNG